MKILILVLPLVLLTLDYSVAERSGAVSSKKGNRSYSSNRGYKNNHKRNNHNKSHHHNKSRNNFTYNKGQQTYLNPYYLRNGYNPDILDPGHRRNKHDRGDYYRYYYPYYGYSAYNYPYYYDYGYDSTYYESDYLDRNTYERDTLQQYDKDTNIEQYQKNQSKDYHDTGNIIDNYDLQYDESQYSNEVDVDTIIYRWTDGEGNEHYTNNPKKVPDEFKDTIVEMETW